MIVKSCPNCVGRPYTTDLSETTCPICGGTLTVETMPDSEIYTRVQLSPVNDADNTNAIASSSVTSNGKKDRGSNTIVGTVYGYSNSLKEGGNYRRLVITKIIDALFYAQRTDDELHRFYIKPENNDASDHDIPVVVHGVLSAGSGIHDNTLAKVSGRFKNGTLYAKNIKIVNNGYESPVKFQLGVGKIILAIVALIVTVGSLLLFAFDKNLVNTFLNQAKTFISLSAIIFIILIVFTAFIISSSRIIRTLSFMMGKVLPVYTIIDAILALVISALLMKFYGASFSATGILSSIGPVVIVIAGIVLMMCGLFKKR